MENDGQDLRWKLFTDAMKEGMSIEEAVQFAMEADDGGNKEQNESMRLVMKAMNAESEAEGVRLLEEALKIWPDNIDAKAQLVYFSHESEIETYTALLDLEWEEGKRWKEAGRPSYAQEEARPYLQFKFYMGDLAMSYNFFDQAENHFKAAFDLEEGDSLGCRYKLAALYMVTGNWPAIKNLYRSLQEVFEEDDQLMFCMAIAAFQSGKPYLSEEYFLRVMRLNRHVAAFFEPETIKVDHIHYLSRKKFFERDSQASLAVVFDYVLRYFGSADLVYSWFRTLSQKHKAATRQRISLEEAGKSPLLKDLNPTQKRSLVDHQLITPDDFRKVTADYVLGLYGIGPKTIEKLRQLGVQFKDD